MSEPGHGSIVALAANAGDAESATAATSTIRVRSRRMFTRIGTSCGQTSMVAIVCTLLLLSGCGSGPSKQDRAAVDAELATIQLELAGNIAAEAKDGSGDIPMATRDLIRFVRKNRGTLGESRSRSILAQAARDAEPFCRPCFDDLMEAGAAL